MELTPNPLLAPEQVKTLDLAGLTSPVVLVRGKKDRRRDLLDARRLKTAAEAIAGLTKDNEVFGFTKGQFSLLDLIAACLERTGPASMTLSTWTAARKEIQDLDRMAKEGRLLSARWLVDYTFARRDPEAAHQIRLTFGMDSMRVAKTHSKFAVFENAEWRLVVRSSMNLNMNPRFEDFTVAHDPELAAFLGTIVEEVFAKQKGGLLDGKGAGAIDRYFRDEM